MYGITNRESFLKLAAVRDDLLRARDGSETPLVIVGNMCDLSPAKRQVNEAEARQMADGWGVPFFEVSAKLRISVEDAFFQLAREMTRLRNSAREEQKAGDKAEKCVIA